MKTEGRVVGYVRVSLEDQVEGFSLPAQRREIQRYCDRKGYSLVRIYADEGVSARSDRVEARPKLQALLAAAPGRGFDLVVVHTLDRWARNVAVQRQALQVLGTNGVGFASVNEDIDFTTPQGRLMLTLMGGVAEFFSDQLGVHVSKARAERARRGLPTGPLPFGYESVSPAHPARPVPREANAVRRAFEQKLLGESNGQIASWFNEQGLRTRTGRLFTTHAIKDMLNCVFYAGLVRWRDETHEGQHEAVVSKEIFALAGARRTRRREGRAMAGLPRGILSGRLHCGRCGNRLHADRGRRGQPMYREQHGRECAPNGRAFMVHRLDPQISQIFEGIRLPATWKSSIAQAAAGRPADATEAVILKRQRLARAYADGAFSDVEYTARRASLDTQLRNLAKNIDVGVEEAATLLEDLPKLWEEARPDERRVLLAPLIERAYVDVDSKRIVGITPGIGSAPLLADAIERVPGCSAVLLRPDELELLHVGFGGDAGGRVTIGSTVYEIPLYSRTVGAPTRSAGGWQHEQAPPTWTRLRGCSRRRPGAPSRTSARGRAKRPACDQRRDPRRAASRQLAPAAG